MSSILDEIRYLVDLGIKGNARVRKTPRTRYCRLDVTLLGQNVNSYCDKSAMDVSLNTTKSLSRGFRENYRTDTSKGTDLARSPA